MNVDVSQWTYNWVFVIGAISTVIGMVAKHFIHKAIEKHIEELKNYFDPMASRLNRIEYALYNDGKTGLINKVDALLENQQCIRIDVEVLKTKIEK